MSSHRSLGTALAVLCLASPLAAQGFSQDTAIANLAPSPVSAVVAVPAPDVAPAATPAAALAPTLVNASVGFHTNAVSTTAFQPQSSQGSHNPAMMIVGGAALIVGAIIGGKAGTIVMIGGGIIGLVGLWNYLQ